MKDLPAAQALTEWYREQTGTPAPVETAPAPAANSAALLSSLADELRRDTRLRAPKAVGSAAAAAAPGGGGGSAVAAREAADRRAAAAQNTARPLVLIIQGAQFADPDSLRDLILTLSEVRNVATSLVNSPEYLKGVACSDS